MDLSPAVYSLGRLNFSEWEFNFTIPTRDIVRLSGESLPRDRTEISSVIHKRIRRVPVGLETWEYRSNGEYLYGTNLGAMDCEDGSGLFGMLEYTILFKRRLWCGDFRSHHKSDVSEQN